MEVVAPESFRQTLTPVPALDPAHAAVEVTCAHHAHTQHCTTLRGYNKSNYIFHSALETVPFKHTFSLANMQLQVMFLNVRILRKFKDKENMYGRKEHMT